MLQEGNHWHLGQIWGIRRFSLYYIIIPPHIVEGDIVPKSCSQRSVFATQKEASDLSTPLPPLALLPRGLRTDCHPCDTFHSPPPPLEKGNEILSDSTHGSLLKEKHWNQKETQKHIYKKSLISLYLKIFQVTFYSGYRAQWFSQVFC